MPAPPEKRLLINSRLNVGMQAHGYPELCLAVSGNCALDVPGGRIPLSSGAVAVLMPGAEHCEGWARRGQSYVLLWLRLTERSPLVFVSVYMGDACWESVVSMTIGPRHTRNVLGCLTSGLSVMDHLPALRLALLAGLTEMLQEQSEPSVSRGGKRCQVAEPVAAVVRYCEDHLDQPLNVRDIAGILRLSPNYLNTLFSRELGCGIHQYLTRLRMDRAWELCEEPGLLIKQIAFEVGYRDALHFSRAFKRHHGCAPRAAQQKLQR